MNDLSETNDLLNYLCELVRDIKIKLETIIEKMDATLVQTLITDLLEALAALTAAKAGTADAQAKQKTAEDSLAALQATDAALQDPALTTAANTAIANAAAANLGPAPAPAIAIHPTGTPPGTVVGTNPDGTPAVVSGPNPNPVTAPTPVVTNPDGTPRTNPDGSPVTRP